MRKITLILKPTDECNFRCQYCYHADTDYEKGKMTIDLFEEIIKKTTSCYNDIVLIFHGGEPLLMGYDFFEKAIDIINRYKKDGVLFKRGIQTNGYLLNDKFCKLFEANDILPAISFDGPDELNCLRDKTTEVTNKIVDLKSKGYSINLLGVITKKNLGYLGICYEFAKSNGCNMKLNPVFISGGAKLENDYLIDVEEYNTAIMNFIPQWMKDENSINNFEPLSSLSFMAITKQGQGCASCGCLSKWISIHHDGTMYPCGRSYTYDYSLGNIRNIDMLSLAFNHKNFIDLLKGAIERRNYCYEHCCYFSLCQGGCNNDAILKGDITKPDGFNCAVYKQIIPFIQEYIRDNYNEIKNKYVLELIKRSSDGQHND